MKVGNLVRRPQIYVAAMLLASASVVAVVSFGGPSGAQANASGHGPSSIFHGVDQRQLAGCLRVHGNCLETVPGLVRCMHRYKVCDLAASHKAQKESKVAASVTQSQALTEIGWTGSSTQTTGSELLSYAQAETAAPNLAESDSVAPGTQVWLETLYYSQPQTVAADGGYGPPGSGGGTTTVSSVSAVIDASTGMELDYCLGCAVVPSGTTAQ